MNFDFSEEGFAFRDEIRAILLRSFPKAGRASLPKTVTGLSFT